MEKETGKLIKKHNKPNRNKTKTTKTTLQKTRTKIRSVNNKKYQLVTRRKIVIGKTHTHRGGGISALLSGIGKTVGKGVTGVSKGVGRMTYKITSYPIRSIGKSIGGKFKRIFDRKRLISELTKGKMNGETMNRLRQLYKGRKFTKYFGQSIVKGLKNASLKGDKNAMEKLKLLGLGDAKTRKAFGLQSTDKLGRIKTFFGYRGKTLGKIEKNALAGYAKNLEKYEITRLEKKLGQKYPWYRRFPGTQLRKDYKNQLKLRSNEIKAKAHAELVKLQAGRKMGASKFLKLEKLEGKKLGKWNLLSKVRKNMLKKKLQKVSERYGGISATQQQAMMAAQKSKAMNNSLKYRQTLKDKLKSRNWKDKLLGKNKRVEQHLIKQQKQAEKDLVAGVITKNNMANRLSASKQKYTGYQKLRNQNIKISTRGSKMNAKAKQELKSAKRKLVQGNISTNNANEKIKQLQERRDLYSQKQNEIKYLKQKIKFADETDKLALQTQLAAKQEAKKKLRASSTPRNWYGKQIGSKMSHENRMRQFYNQEKKAKNAGYTAPKITPKPDHGVNTISTPPTSPMRYRPLPPPPPVTTSMKYRPLPPPPSPTKINSNVAHQEQIYAKVIPKSERTYSRPPALRERQYNKNSLPNSLKQRTEQEPIYAKLNSLQSPSSQPPPKNLNTIYAKLAYPKNIKV